MTLTDLQKLAESDEGKERIRVMVADIQGYEVLCENKNFGYPPVLPEDEGLDDEDEPVRLPLYTTSLDAMAECEAGLTDRHERIKYQNILAELTTVGGDERSLDSEFAHMTASALHRAMAYILTKTKGAK